MEHKHLIRNYRHWYSKLLRLYPKPYYERFGEEMEQTFSDILYERSVENEKILQYALWMFIETSKGIIKENITVTIMKNKNILRIAFATVVLLMIPLVAMLFTDEMNWDETDFLVMGVLIFSTGFVFDLLSRKVQTTKRRVILALVLLGAFLLIWADLAVGIFNIPGISGS